ncbi:hypothetical protein CFOL_v3_09660 [Cephalotus follicularis]|uniref:Uncharacterized protein n=1 Tax=Cephalotus follicularis TaxID=3775 RepID=A0A1Q3BDR5_CEPFO|nr:hypothetical protein CFOL_v3_09660 [Cephalotus follicularis]
MNSKQNPIRALGQRSIRSSFISRSSNPFQGSKEDVKKKASTKVSPVSLSDFLDQKLHKSSVPPNIVQRKESPFSSPVGPREIGGSSDGQMMINKEWEKEKTCLLDKVVLEQFKHTSTEELDCGASCEAGNCSTADIVQGTRKRINPFEGGNGEDITRNRVLVLGDDPKPKQNQRQSRFISKKKQRPLHKYNHYANGCGWWDCDMEGVDSEEVGYGEVWEGVGSTTFGGIEWH